MNPYKAVAGQSAFLIGFVVVAFLFGREPTYWVLLVAMAAFGVVSLILLAVYAIGRRRGHGTSRLSRWRRGGDALAVIEALGPMAAAALCALVIGKQGPFADVFAALTISTIMTALALLFGTLTASSMVDWFYIRPARDGVVRQPPCTSADDPRWAALTKAWLMHRLVAESAFVLFFLLTGLALILEGVQGDGLGFWVRTAAVAAITITGIALSYSSARLRVSRVGMPGANENVRFALGETLSWKVNGNEVMRVRLERQWRVGIYEVTLRKVERQGKKRPPLHATGKLGYVRGVSLGPADILEMNRNQDGSVLRALEVPMDVLFHDTAKIERDQISWCSREERCLKLQDRCELAGRTFG